MFPQLNVERKFVSPYPCTITRFENIWIPLDDGVKLSAKLWMPDMAEGEKVPTIFEAIPYRKRDATVTDDELLHTHFAGHGYASIRVDLRGSGDSEGILLDEYLEREQNDNLEIISWIQNQIWSDGNVGMMGISWGGFASLQAAALNPEGLKAVISVGSVVDRFNEDVHYKGGCMTNEHAGWAFSMLCFSARCPDPELAGDRWKELWLNRLENQPFLAETWFRHQVRDEYWTHGSVCEDYSKIKCPVLSVSGWADAYMNAIPGLVENLDSPCNGIVGPWPHSYPHLAVPGPGMDFLSECLNWWDHWLKDKNNDVENLPKYRLFCTRGCQTDPWLIEKDGYWIELDSLEPDPVKNETWYLNANGLSRKPGRETIKTVSTRLDMGFSGGELIPHCSGPEMPLDQSFDDGGSLLFETEVLSEAKIVIGTPVLNLSLSSDKPQANLIVRLCDVDDRGRSQRISWGALNLCQRDSQNDPTPIEPGRAMDVEIKFNHMAHEFPKGHRIRIAISNAYWPLIWPSPEINILRISTVRSSFYLPLMKNENISSPDMGIPALPDVEAVETLQQAKQTRSLTYNVNENSSIIKIKDDLGRHEVTSHGMVFDGIAEEEYFIKPDDPCSAAMSKSWCQNFSRGEWNVTIKSVGHLSCDKNNFFLKGQVQTYEGGKKVFEKNWNDTVPRQNL